MAVQQSCGMEVSLRQLMKEANKTKHAVIHKTCQDLIDLLSDAEVVKAAAPYQLRERCLVPVQLALESKSSRLCVYAVACIQHLFTDERFQSNMESEQQCYWLPMQVLSALHCTSALPDVVQIDIMKLLLTMTMTSSWCMNAPVIIAIIKLCMTSLSMSSQQSVRGIIVNLFLRILHSFAESSLTFSTRYKIMLESSAGSGSCSVRTAATAAFTQLLSTLSNNLQDVASAATGGPENADVAEFASNNKLEQAKSLCDDYLTIMNHLCDKLESNRSYQVAPLLLEGILIMLSGSPTMITKSQSFHNIVWQKLCPALIHVLANPLTDKTLGTKASSGGVGCGVNGGGASDEVGRGSGCSNAAPNIMSSSAKAIYSISVELVRCVGRVSSLSPVIESLFHRILLYHPPIHRLDALKALQPLLSSPFGLLVLAGPFIDDSEAKSYVVAGSNKKKHGNQLSLLRLIVDSLQECCHCNDSVVAITSINLVNDILKSVEQLVKGCGISDEEKEAIPKNGLARLTAVTVDSIKSMLSGSHSDSAVNIPSDAVLMRDDLSKENEHDDEVSLSDREIKVIERTSELKTAEQACAVTFIQQLAEFVCTLNECSETSDVDLRLQDFASRFCEDKSIADGQNTILNADAVYVTIYSVLHLSFTLKRCGYFSSKEKSLPISEQQFVDDILGMGLLLYVSRSWLSVVFHQVISKDMLHMQRLPSALISLLADVDGFNNHEVNGQFLSIYRNNSCDYATCELSISVMDCANLNADMMLLGRRILLTCWDNMLDVLSVLISGRSACGITGSLALMFNAKEESRKARQAICTSLEGLQTATRLSSTLGLHELCASVFEHLAAASCVVELDEIKRERQLQQPSQQAADKKPTSASIAAILPSSSAGTSARQRIARLHAAHALCMDVLLDIGLEMGSHTSACWKHVFRCCSHISELEHTYFSSGENQQSLSQLHSGDLQSTSLASMSADDGIKDDDTCLYTSMPPSAVDPQPAVTVATLIQESSAESGWDNTVVGGGVLSAAQSSKVLCRLSHEVDRLFEDAALKLNLKALLGFLSELCLASRQQLSAINKRSSVELLPPNSLLLYRFDNILSKCITSDRPQLHTMRIWCTVAPHLVEAACHRDGGISKRAVDCIHNVLTKLLSSYAEMPHFHFNESLCKPFENLLCLELCDGDVQDQVVCSICELVEACTSNIKSGWRPLFGALRAVKIQYTANEEVNEARQRHIFAVLDVFDVFLATDNITVFSNAAVDCILCLLKYVRGPGEFEMKDGSDSSDSEDEGTNFDSTLNLCLPALHYLRQCCNIIATMHRMPNCPVFDGAHRIHIGLNRPLDCFTPSVDLQVFCNLLTDNNELTNSEFVQPDALPVNINIIDEQSRYGQRCDAHGDTATGRTALGIGSESIHSSDNSSESDSDDTHVSDTHHGVITESKELSRELIAPDVSTKEALSDSTDNDKFGLSAVEVALSSSSMPALKCSSAAKSLVNEEDAGGRSQVCDSEMSSGSDSKLSMINKSQLLFHSDKPGALRVYFLVIEGLSSTVSACPKNYQPQTLEMLFELMRLASCSLGAEFALHCVGALLLPTLQSWLRRGNGNVSAATGAASWDATTIANFKHYAGLCVDLVVEFVIEFAGNTELMPHVELMLQQQLGIFVDCIGQPLETISRLGCSCIRHCLVNCGAVLTEQLWWLAAQALRHAFDLTLYPLRQLMMPFHENSDNFYGDVGQVKVAVRQDSTPAESARLRQLAQQVFLLDNQSSSNAAVSASIDSDKSYVFLFYSSSSQSRNENTPIARVPFRSLVVGLMSHQLLIQTVGSLLLSGSTNIVPAEQGILGSDQNCVDSKYKTNLRSKNALPGLMSFMSARVVFSLLQCLRSSYHAAVHFDSRPGLKFLVQKVCCIDVAANLYKQSGVVYTLYMHALLEVSMKLEDMSVQNVRKLLGDCDGGCLLLGFNHQSGSMENKTHSGCKVQLTVAQQSLHPVNAHVSLFVHLLKSAYDEASSRYIDLFLEQEGPNAADRLSERSLLVFLLDEEAPLPQLPRERSLSEMVADKLRRRQSVDSVSSELSSPQSPDAGMKRPLSPILSEPRSHKPQLEDRIYTVATDRTIKSVMKEFRKRKQAQLMPKPTAVSSRAAKSTVTGSGQTQAHSVCKGSKDPVDKHIEEQQRSSIMKDGEAHMRSSIELLCNMLQLLDQLPSDVEYHALLPTAFGSVALLIGHCRDRRLRETLSRWTYRIGSLFEITAPGDVMTEVKY